MPVKHIVFKFVLLHTFLFSLNKASAKFAIRILIAAPRDKLLVIIESRYVNWSMASRVSLSMLIVDGGAVAS